MDKIHGEIYAELSPEEQALLERYPDAVLQLMRRNKKERSVFVYSEAGHDRHKRADFAEMEKIADKIQAAYLGITKDGQ